jgi:hypothetical protein
LQNTKSVILMNDYDEFDYDDYEQEEQDNRFNYYDQYENGDDLNWDCYDSNLDLDQQDEDFWG